WNLILLLPRPEMLMTQETIKLERMKKEKGLCSLVPLPPDTLGKELTEIISMKSCLAEWEQVDPWMGNKGCCDIEELTSSANILTMNLYWVVVTMNMSYAMVARVRIPFFLKRTGCSSSDASSVVHRGLLLPSRLDSLPKWAVVRLDL
ncbi:hypothetical protein ACJX0J_006650, partial [Zea mays]